MNILSMPTVSPFPLERKMHQRSRPAFIRSAIRLLLVLACGLCCGIAYGQVLPQVTGTGGDLNVTAESGTKAADNPKYVIFWLSLTITGKDGPFTIDGNKPDGSTYHDVVAIDARHNRALGGYALDVAKNTPSLTITIVVKDKKGNSRTVTIPVTIPQMLTGWRLDPSRTKIDPNHIQATLLGINPQDPVRWQITATKATKTVPGGGPRFIDCNLSVEFDDSKQPVFLTPGMKFTLPITAKVWPQDHSAQPGEWIAGTFYTNNTLTITPQGVSADRNSTPVTQTFQFEVPPTLSPDSTSEITIVRAAGPSIQDGFLAVLFYVAASSPPPGPQGTGTGSGTPSNQGSTTTSTSPGGRPAVPNTPNPPGSGDLPLAVIMGPTGRGGQALITGTIKLQAQGADLKTGDQRAFLGTVPAGSPFARAGIHSGDEIASINGRAVDTMTQAEIEAAFRNKEVKVVIWRNEGKDMFSTAIQTP